MSSFASEVKFARALEACATGATVHETIAAITGFDPEDGSPMTTERAQALSEAAQACCDVAAEYIEQGIEREDADASWARLRAWGKRLKARGYNI